jgi:SWI/SNF-related matrix-associated actin-dependent regulator 1 of chromatin subfamily A
LLTGTPALAKPKDLFNSLNIIRPDIFSSFKEFGYRYCDPKLSKFINGIDFDGASNLKELHYLLKNYIMIRRLKKEVLS